LASNLFQVTSRQDQTLKETNIQKWVTGTLYTTVTYLAYLLCGGVVLDQFAVLHAEARPHAVDLLVDLSPVVVALLPSAATKNDNT
jgi:hypothetical protein